MPQPTRRGSVWGAAFLSLSQLAAIHRRVCTSSRSSWWPGGTPAAGRGSARGWTPGRASVATFLLLLPFLHHCLLPLFLFLLLHVALRERIKAALRDWIARGRLFFFRGKSENSALISSRPRRVLRGCHAEATRVRRGGDTHTRALNNDEEEITTIADDGEDKMPRASVVHMTSTATRPHHMSQVLATLALSMGTFSAGLAKGYTSPALDSILDNKTHLYQSNNSTWLAFSVTQQEASWVASLSMLGAWFGAMIGDWIMRRGRRLALRMTSLPLAATWVLTGVAPCVELVYVTSFIGGLCCSVVTMVAQVYISEISMPGIRGCLSAMLKVLGHVGVLLSYIAGMYLNWRQSALLVAVAPSMFFLGTLFIPETPSYLVLNDKDDEAADSLQWLRGQHVDIRHELQVIKTNILASRAKQYELSFKNSMFTPRLYKPIAITCGLMFFLRFSGANAFNYYAVLIFRQTLGGMNPHGATIAIGFVQLLASLLSGFLIDIVGRLPLLIASTVFMSLALAGFGSYSYYVSQTQSPGYAMDSAMTGQHDWIPLLCVLVFTTALALGISPISWLLIGELFPLEYRGLGSSISTSFSYFCAFIGIKLFMDFQQNLGLYGAFWFYAAVAVCGLCFVVCCVPETRGRQLDEMNPDYAQAR
ncbi:facilitated trehalose transporter Tret1 isoform X1 [Monomorium pharaonis]|uniref:facilitated trehalose transporter Tret1 isoform X1 n=1 Tax=Monomorium pharaonis TaxID=307658 RepID=UPI001746A935|nr:facilitated trehalose transporter Tret1 isoform X1 [Monomorium pharaonis]